jgi:PAS domain-containing protein
MKNFSTNSDLEFSNEGRALKKNRYRSIDNIKCLTFTVSLDLTIFDANEAAVKGLGYDSKYQLTDKPLIATIYDPATYDELKEIFDKLEDKQDLRDEEVTLISSEGKTLRVMLNIDTVLDSTGNPLCRVLTHVAFTNNWVDSRKSRIINNRNYQLEGNKDQKKESNEQSFLVEGIIEQSLFAISISDPTGTIVKTNKKYREYKSVSSDEILGKLNVFEDLALIENGAIPKVKAVFNNLKPARFNIYSSNPVFRDNNQKGTQFIWLHVFVYPVLGNDGQLKSVVFQWINSNDRDNTDDLSGSNGEFAKNVHRKGHSMIL